MSVWEAVVLGLVQGAGEFLPVSSSGHLLLLEKLGKTPYRIKYETPLNTLEAHARRFAELGIADQCRVLMQILNLFNTSAASADLKLLCGKAGIGILRTPKNLSGYAGHSFLLIHQSVTGVFEKQIDLLGDEF